jgi:alkylhydroperoxidase family enzyme
VQRSIQAGRQGLTEAKYDELLNFADSDKFTEREKVALTYTSAIAWNSEIADDALWAKLHQHFSIPELVELGFIGLTLANSAGSNPRHRAWRGAW